MISLRHLRIDASGVSPSDVMTVFRGRDFGWKGTGRGRGELREGGGGLLGGGVVGVLDIDEVKDLRFRGQSCWGEVQFG